MNKLSNEKNAKYLLKEIEVFARLFEKTVHLMAHERSDSYKLYFDRRYNGKVYLPDSDIKKSKAIDLIRKIIKT